MTFATKSYDGKSFKFSQPFHAFGGRELMSEEELSSEIRELCVDRGVECCVIEVVPVDKSNYIVEVWMEGFGTAILEGSGSYILEAVNEILDEIEKDVVVCPFCGHEAERRRLLRFCVCGAEVVTEDSKIAGHFFSPALEELWGEATLALGLSSTVHNLKRVLHVDKAFENVFYVGKGITSWRTWFLKRPWRLSRLANLVNELHESVESVSVPFLEEHIKSCGVCQEHAKVKPPGECVGKLCPFFAECVRSKFPYLKDAIRYEEDIDTKWRLEAVLREAEEFIEHYAIFYEKVSALATSLENSEG